MTPFRYPDREPSPAPPDDLPPAPRRAELTPTARSVRLASLLGLLIVPTFLLLAGYLSGSEERALSAEGVRLTGTLTRLDRYVSNKSDGWDVEYRYDVQGRAHHGKTWFGVEEGKARKLGGPVEVTYLPSNPDTHCLGKPQARLARTTGFTFIMALVAAGALGCWLGFLEWQVRRELRLARGGTAVAGTIVDAGAEGHGRYRRYWVTYQVAAKAAGWATTWHYVHVCESERLPRGTPITVLVDPDSPSDRLPLFAFKWVDMAAAVAPAAGPAVEAEIDATPLPDSGHGDGIATGRRRWPDA